MEFICCNALQRNEICKNKFCKYGHTRPKENEIINCIFDKCCEKVRTKFKPVGFWKVVNKGSKICPYKHSDEHLLNYYLRIGYDILPEENIHELYRKYDYVLLEKENNKEMVKKEKKICIAIVKKTGVRCKNKVKDEFVDYCGVHKKYFKNK